MSENYTLHGALPPYVIKKASRDKLGFLKAEIHVQRPMPVDFAHLAGSGAPDVVGVPCVDAAWVGDNKGIYTIAYSYDGQTDAGNSSNGFENTPVVCSLEGSDSEEPLETHPEFLQILDKYGGTLKPDFSFTFPAIAPKKVGGDGKMKNPLYGILDYLNIGWVWVKSYASPNIPPLVYQAAGCIDAPQGSGLQQPPPVTAYRNYLKLAPRCQWRGNAWQIDERWRAGGRMGINQDIYKDSGRY